MSIFDKVKGLLGDNADKVEQATKQGIDKAADLAKSKTGGKYDQHIDTAADKAKEMADKLDGQQAGQPSKTGQQNTTSGE